MKNTKTKMLCEAAIFIAMAEILSLIKLYEFPNGGSVTLEMLPIILFAARYGCGWGAGAGLVYGAITYLIGNKFSIDWTTIICDYFLAFVALGFGAGLLSRRKWSVYYGTLIGGVLRFLLTRFVQINSMSSFPWGTTAVNLLGCLVLGVLYGLFSRGLLLHTETRLFLTVGLCGGFTTFSTLMNESFLLLKEGNFPAFFLYTLLSFAGGLIAIGLGYLAAR